VVSGKRKEKEKGIFFRVFRVLRGLVFALIINGDFKRT
jgi:hypothetical protein